MHKKVVILLTFLAYALTLVHSVVPHHHHEQVNTSHHHHGNDEHHHHDDDHEEKKNLSHVFADAIHHPASEIVIHPPESGALQKKQTTVDILIVKLNELLIPELKPPNLGTIYQENFHLSGQDSFFLLRAPPAA